MTSMHALTSARGPTPAELDRLENEAGVEFADGQLVEKPVSLKSTEVPATISSLLRAADPTRTLRIFNSELCYRCFPDDPERYRKPNLSAVLRAKIAHLPDDTGMMPLPADLAVEVLSPGDDLRIFDKVDKYLTAGFGEIWLVHPPTRSVHIYRQDGSVTKLRENDELTYPPLPAFRAKVADVLA